jgi:hypothetical protein
MVAESLVMRVHTYLPLGATLPGAITKRIKYKIYDFGDMCIIAYSSTQVECYRFVDRRQEGDNYIEVLEKQPIGYTPSGDAICSIVDIGLTKDPNTMVYGNYLLKISEENGAIGKPTNVFEQMSSQREPRSTKPFKRKPLESRPSTTWLPREHPGTSIPLVMQQPQHEDSSPKKIRPRVPMMSIPLMMPAAME